MKSYIFDTSFLISLLNINDENHNEAIKKIGNIEIGNGTSNFFINENILNETYTVLNYKKGFEFLETLDNFLNELEASYLSGNNDEYIGFFKNIAKKISVADTTVIYDALKYNLEILSFDKEMIKISKNLKK